MAVCRVPSRSADISKGLMKVALGQEAADLVVVNATLLNVYTGELLEDYSVSIKGEWIASVGDDPMHTIGQNTVVIDAKGKVLIPGLIDGHAHLAWLFSVSEFLKFAMRGGTTAIITETLEPFPVLGYQGVVDFLASCADQPIRIFATAPSMVSISRKAREISAETVRMLLEREDVLGLGESYWQAVLQEPDRMLSIFEEAFRAGKCLEGHSAGASGKKLTAYTALGISTCHEPITAEEVIERLRLGLYVMIREGSIRRDLKAISGLKDTPVDLRRVILVTDGISPGDLVEKGYMEHVVQKAIDYGLEPVEAIRMATLNVAEHFSLDDLIGGIAPGRYADMVAIPDITTMDAHYVISKGRIIAQKRRVSVPPREHLFSEDTRKSIHLPKTLEASDFSIRVKGSRERVEARVIDLITDLVTGELKVVVPAVNGEIRADVGQDILKVAAIDRTHCPGKMFVGLIRGFGMKAGAMACSAAWDTSDIIVVGADEADMAHAVNRVHTLQGGAVLCAGNQILAEVPLPVMGIISDLPVEALAQEVAGFKKAASHLGVSFSDPLLTLITLTTAAIPFLRICEEGLVNLRDGNILDLT